MIKNADIRTVCDTLVVLIKEAIIKVLRQVTGKLM